MDAMETMKRAFDGNVLSSPKTVKTQNDAWVGLDLGRVVSISNWFICLAMMITSLRKVSYMNFLLG